MTYSEMRSKLKEVCSAGIVSADEKRDVLIEICDGVKAAECETSLCPIYGVCSNILKTAPEFAEDLDIELAFNELVLNEIKEEQ